MTVHTLMLPWQRPPLSLNRQLHWVKHANLAAEIRQTTGWLAKAAKIPASEFCEVTLYWAPKNKRTRDDDNIVDSMKHCCDGLVDAGIVVDDDPIHMRKNMPVVEAVTGTPSMWLIVEVWESKP